MTRRWKWASTSLTLLAIGCSGDHGTSRVSGPAAGNDAAAGNTAHDTSDPAQQDSAGGVEPSSDSSTPGGAIDDTSSPGASDGIAGGDTDVPAELDVPQGPEEPVVPSTQAALPLAVVSTPIVNTFAGSSWTYEVRTSSTEGATYELLQGPPGMVMGADGVVTWDIPAGFTGEVPVSIRAGVGGAFIEQGFLLNTTALLGANLGLISSSMTQIVADGAVPSLAGAALVAPDGAIGGEVTVSISTPSSPLPLPGEPAGAQTTQVAFGPSGTTFDTPVDIYLPYTPDGTSAKSIRAYVYQESTGAWSRVPVKAVDEVNGLVVVEAQHFSVYAAGAFPSTIEVSAMRTTAADDCARDVAMQASLDVPLSEVPTGDIAVLPPSLAQLVKDGSIADSVEALLLHSEFSGSLRAIWTLSPGMPTDDGWCPIALSSFAVTVTRQADGSTRTALADTNGRILAERVDADLAAAWDDVELWLRGQGIVARFRHPEDEAIMGASYLYLRHYAADASALPISLADVRQFAAKGYLTLEIAPPTDGASPDVDCDTVADVVDASVVAPAIHAEAHPDRLVLATAGTSLPLHCAVFPGDADVQWQWRSDGHTSTIEPGPQGTAAFTALVPGFHQVQCDVVASDGATASCMFTVDARAASPSQPLAPRCRVTAVDSSLRVGETTLLEAEAIPASDDDLTYEWGLWVNGELIPSDVFRGRDADEAAFGAWVPGEYPVACRISRGSELGKVGVFSVHVAPEEENQLPEGVYLTPAFSVVSVDEPVVLTAGARDPDGDALSFDWWSNGFVALLGESASQSKGEFVSSQPGLFFVGMQARDSRGAKVPRAAQILVLGEDATSANDEDGDGVPASLDCDDFDAASWPGGNELCDGADNDCDGIADDGLPDWDGDGVPNCLDPDDDGDGVADGEDSCPLVANPSQVDSDVDGKGDACDPGACTPTCEGKTCGADGCGGVCGFCASGSVCVEGQCSSFCEPMCAGKVCGADGCGGLCGLCGARQVCDEGQCVPDCAPTCNGKVCGSDGCGGLCGTCGDGAVCDGGVCVDE